MATNVNDPYGIIGKWFFNETISIKYLGFDPKIIFSSNGFAYNRMYVDSSSLTYGDYSPDYTPVNRLFHKAFTPTGGWTNPEYRTVTITGGDSLTNETFANWLKANAVKAEPTPTDAVTIEYNGAVIASLKAGQSATLPCKDTLMHTDVVVSVPDGLGGADSPLPIEIATEAEMTALLENAEVGSVYKYTGATGTYESGTFYVVEVGLISFTIAGTSYEAEDGMTWAEWVKSEYNTGGYEVFALTIQDSDGLTVTGSENGTNYQSVAKTDIISSSFSYLLAGGTGGSND